MSRVLIVQSKTTVFKSFVVLLPRAVSVTKYWHCVRTIGADITDYFNYGFTEDTWKQYCEKQRRLRMDLNMPKKTFVVSFKFHFVRYL